MNREWIVDLVERLPAGAMSRAWGWVARRHRPRLGVSLLKRAFVAAARIDMTEAEADLRAYGSLEELFVRRLRQGARRIDIAPEAIVSPVDGVVGAHGIIRDGTLMQVKGRAYSLAHLLDDAAAAARFDGGPFCTLYLSPRDYHRVHAPLSGFVREAALIPGRLLPVFPEATLRVPELFARNERLISYLDTPDCGRLAVVKVGATLVGRIRAAYDDALVTNARGSARRTLTYDPPRPVQKGAELGAFEMGSTVVLVGEPGMLKLTGLTEGASLRMGQRIGTIAARTATSRKRATGSSGARPKQRRGGHDGEPAPAPASTGRRKRS